MEGIKTNGCSCAPNSWKGVQFRDICDGHDIDYAEQKKTRRAADIGLYRGMRRRGACVKICRVYYRAVRTFGWIFWFKVQVKARMVEVRNQKP